MDARLSRKDEGERPTVSRYVDMGLKNTIILCVKNL